MPAEMQTVKNCAHEVSDRNEESFENCTGGHECWILAKKICLHFVPALGLHVTVSLKVTD
jgi:hypothetical protein